ncbi:unnamed protein product [Arabis nemorensis]|uniref:Hexosyltransferase n=1 Tax=Arabis nemorensis TaxID=586526 RepID=A0A565BSF5_9BRAS|nr:unnamed protein product [Arabis nemorensis]
MVKKQRVVGLKKRIEILQSEVESANAELEDAKRIKEVAEEELNGYEVELSLNDATIQSLEARIALLHDEISTVGNEVEALKNKEGLLRDQFISQMEELNKEIREFQKVTSNVGGNGDSTGITKNVKVFEGGYGADSEAIKDMLSDVNSQIAIEEEGYPAEQNIQTQLQKELDEYEKKMSLMEAITDRTNSVQALARYPYLHYHVSLMDNKQTSELEQILASLGEELQKRCRCQNCHAENLEILSLLLQGDEDFLNMFFEKVFKPVPPVYNLILSVLWRHPGNVDLESVKVVHYCPAGSKPWRYTGEEPNMDREDVKMLINKWWDIYNDESLDFKPEIPEDLEETLSK